MSLFELTDEVLIRQNSFKGQGILTISKLIVDVFTLHKINLTRLGFGVALGKVHIAIYQNGFHHKRIPIGFRKGLSKNKGFGTHVLEYPTVGEITEINALFT